MSDLFEEENEDSVEVNEDFEVLEEEVDLDPEVESLSDRDVDARRRLESMLDERRLRDELDDFADY